ncbi:hypothetical protein BD410DRAFT_783457 [Rickenella mellea]|uniref:Uncharacterized protein n=1 Tax=Rickenella mellea TaxID=50990 RepID=A0A4Y7QGD8_9AGAM|nr:hypothetical protein BD410DRAFT_783457 [Rickenella mellea]
MFTSKFGLQSISSLLACALVIPYAHGFIPATPTNVTSVFQGANNATVLLEWYPSGSFTTDIFLLYGRPEITSGALVRFSDSDSSKSSTATPWIAFISCDFNTTESSSQKDVFSLAVGLGAEAIFLYSEWSLGCGVNHNFAFQGGNSTNIYMTDSPSMILNQFKNIKNMNASFETYDVQELNNAAAEINQSILTGTNQSPYVIASLKPPSAPQTTSTAVKTNKQVVNHIIVCLLLSIICFL